ncbi:MAG TPA: urate hydroxylase PuuD [Bacteroidota bacterium]
MESIWSEIFNLVFRWVHVIAGILWIGHLWYFNFVNAQVAKTYDDESRKKVVPELMPRALYWFRFGALYTWITGFLLLGIVYYEGGALVYSEQSLMAARIWSIVAMVVGWGIYDQVWKRLAKKEVAGTLVSFILLAGMTYFLSTIMSGRGVFIHLGAVFGTIMLCNVWMRIWPNSRKLIAATKGGTPAPEGAAAMASLRSKHNTYMSIPLIFFMVSNHFPTVYGSEYGWLIALGFVALGWLGAKRLYVISGNPSTAKF